MAIAEKLNYTKTNINKLKELTKKTVLSEVVNDIEQNYGVGSSVEDWQPESDWWDIETILANDTEDYKQKIICLLTDELDDKAATNIVSGAEKYRLSDGQVIEQSANADLDITNLFDTTKDKICSKGYKTRYIIYYSNSESEMNITLADNTIYAIFSGVIFDTTPFSNREFLQSVKFVNNTRFTSTNMANFFNNCRSLKKIPNNLDTSNVVNMSYMFNGCRLLERIPNNLDTSKVLNMTSMFASCYALQQISNLDTSAATNMNNMFNNCYSLQRVLNLDTTNVKSMLNIFNNCYLLSDVSINKIISTLILSSSNYLNHASLLIILNALVDLTGSTTQTLILEANNLEKLTDEEKAIAREKNWTLA